MLKVKRVPMHGEPQRAQTVNSIFTVIGDKCRLYLFCDFFFPHLKGVILLEFVEATVDLILPFKGSQ